ncbi:MAG: 5-oxoprolinase subunit PxpB [Robiginitomaculum sp.]
MKPGADICDYGEAAMVMRFAKTGANLPTAHIRAVATALKNHAIFREIVPGYDSIMVEFNPLTHSHTAVHSILHDAYCAPIKSDDTAREIIDIPVCYGGHYGPDLKAASAKLGLSRDQIISLHSAKIYDVVMMGFIPGFAFLSAADTRLHMPRHASPRAKVAAGSIGIANWQTGIYGLESPGGWQIIGRTPLPMFDKNRERPFLLGAQSRVRFVPVSAAKFKTL